MFINKFSFVFCVALLCSTLQISAQTTANQIEENKKLLRELEQQKEKILAQQETLLLTKVQEDLENVGYPVTKSNCQLIEHQALTLCYDEAHEQAAWVAHIVVPEVTTGNLSRTNDFRPDEKVKTGSAVKDDYWYSGYDRGHIAPSADFRWSKTGISESYLYSNMSPQLAELNRERWAELEGFLRNYVISRGRQIHVVAGGILADDLKKIGKNEVSVPKSYYKVALDLETKTTIGFILPNASCKYPLESYVVSVDHIEELTGINFFPNLAEKHEGEPDINNWKTAISENGVIADVAPIRPPLPDGKFNTVQARLYKGKTITVCGTVVSGKLSQKSGATFLNLDKKFPNQLFSVSIWKDNRANFDYKPEEALLGKQICVTGEISMYQGKPTMNIKSSSQLEVVGDIRVGSENQMRKNQSK